MKNLVCKKCSFLNRLTSKWIRQQSLNMIKVLMKYFTFTYRRHGTYCKLTKFNHWPHGCMMQLHRTLQSIIRVELSMTLNKSGTPPHQMWCNMPWKIHNSFTALFPGPPGWAGARRELLDSMVQGKINRGRNTDRPAGRHSIRTN